MTRLVLGVRSEEPSGGTTRRSADRPRLRGAARTAADSNSSLLATNS
ncbi:hypothetical protein [Spirosoma pulveris]